MTSEIADAVNADAVLTHRGACHCGRVRFEFDAPSRVAVSDCNCSICRMTGYLHITIDKDAFRLIQGESDLSCYEFHTAVAKHYFCSVCGIKSFYVPRSHPEGYSINLRCVEPGTLEPLQITPFDGSNWRAAMRVSREPAE